MAASLEKHIKALKALEGRKVEAGWFESDKYPAEDGQEPLSVAKNARLHEFGGVINHPGSSYITDAIVKGRFVGTRFVRKDFAGEHKVSAAYTIVIPARPFMRYAWSNFNKDRTTIQVKIAKKLIRGEITPDQALGQIGLALEGYIAKSIRGGPWAPNAASTVAKKGFDKPLIDTGHMWKTVSSKVS